MGSTSMYQGLGVVSGVASAISSVYAGKVQAIGYEMQAKAKEAQASAAVSQAKDNNLKLTYNYNNTMSSEMLKFSTQGRSLSSGSIQNILRADSERFNWEKEYMKQSGEYQSAGFLADAKGYQGSAKMAQQAGVTRGLLSLADTATKYKVIK